MAEDNPFKYVLEHKEDAIAFYASVFGIASVNDIFKIMEDMCNSQKTGGKQSMMLDVGNEASAQAIYNSLSADGDWFSPAENEFTFTCELKDKYGVAWLLYYSNPHASKDLFEE